MTVFEEYKDQETTRDKVEWWLFNGPEVYIFDKLFNFFGLDKNMIGNKYEFHFAIVRIILGLLLLFAIITFISIFI